MCFFFRLLTVLNSALSIALTLALQRGEQKQNFDI